MFNNIKTFKIQHANDKKKISHATVAMLVFLGHFVEPEPFLPAQDFRLV